MKNKYFLIRVGGIVFLLLLVVVYFLVYFMPVIENISRYKRDVKDMNLKISDFMKMESSFSYSNQQERSQFKQLEQQLNSRIPEVRTREEFIALFTRISESIRQLAARDGIHSLLLTSDSTDLKINAGSLSKNKESMDDLLYFSTHRLNTLKKEADMKRRMAGNQIPGSVPPAGGVETFMQNVDYHTLWLSFSSDLKSALNFVNHISWNEHYLTEEQLLVAGGETFPFFLVQMRIYYIDLRTNKNSNDTGK